ncbi:hypothetical protein ACFYXS_20805 [Streptomyces sp. NPDC002574]
MPHDDKNARREARTWRTIAARSTSSARDVVWMATLFRRGKR